MSRKKKLIPDLEKIRKALSYDPDTGVFMYRAVAADRLYARANPGGAPRIRVCGGEYSARSLAWYIVTGEYPAKHDLKSLDGNKANVKWSNIVRAKPGYKFCAKCKAEKPTQEFTKSNHIEGGLRGSCKLCESLKRKAHNGKRSITKFGITLEQHQEMLDQQGHVCAICGGIDNNKRLAVDHCHTTSEIRGLLCSKCNQGLGLFKDDPALLAKAAEYLRT